MATKCSIPVEFLRRSCRNQPAASGVRCGTIKKEPVSDHIADIKTDVTGNIKSAVRGLSIKQEPVIHEDRQSSLEEKTLRPALGLGCLRVDSDELDLERTLLGGQSFRWAKSSLKDGRLVFTGVIGKDVLQIWRCDEQQIAFRKLNREEHKPSDEIEELLRDYFQLRYNLKDLYKEWARRDEHFAKCSQSYKGFRILRQDPVENVFSFICATNNNIKRITQMIDKMCKHFGHNLDIGKQATISSTYQTFPTVERLAQDDVFQSLRYDLGFGYRAKFICETAKKMMSSAGSSHLSPSDYLLSLRKNPYKETCKQLQAFSGIGRKVADCICLMSMDHLESVPIDCHIYEIVCRNYMPNLRRERKTLTESVHDLIGNYFNDLHGPLAGWATSVLFVAELKHLRPDNIETSSSGNKEEKKKRLGAPAKTAKIKKVRN